MYCSRPQKMDVLKTFSISNELRIIFLNLQNMVFPDKDQIDFFSFFHRKGVEIVLNNFNENFLFFFLKEY